MNQPANFLKGIRFM